MERKIKISDKKLLEYIKNNGTEVKTFYIDLGVKIVRILCYSDLFIPHLRKQLTYTLCENASKYDVTIVLWQEDDIENIHENKKLCYDEKDTQRGIAHIVIGENTVTFYSPESDTYFYGVKNLEPEEFVKEGHIFVQMFSKILKTDNTNLVHGACIGLNNIGILMCARGCKGKSTLSVLSLLEGFEYVSDDYLTLEKENDNLFAYPIYSIITLSPRMYNELYDKLEGARFLSNNARKDKYVLNISNLHNKFKSKYPVKLGLTLEFTSDENPSVVECNQQERGSAIARLIHSTVIQMHDTQDAKEIKKLANMLNNLKFYKIYLCNNIFKNVECLREIYKGEN
ncbi:hypothetical protein IKQ21_00480 [bacterium]|nr:hypothetical protein [bacterium]